MWTPAADALLIGNMKSHQVDLIDAATGRLTTGLTGEGITAILARTCVHPTLPLVAAGTASGRLHVFK